MAAKPEAKKLEEDFLKQDEDDAPAPNDPIRAVANAKAPAEAMPDTGEKLARVLPSDFKLQTSAYQMHSATVAASVTKKELENADLWDHVARRCLVFDEVRALADDGSWVAYLLVTYVHGGRMRVKLREYIELENTSKATGAVDSRYEVKLKGPLKWCVEDTQTGVNVKTHIDKRSEAYRELEEHLAALGR